MKRSPLEKAHSDRSRRNPTVQIRAVPREIVHALDLTCILRRNPTVQIRAIPTTPWGEWFVFICDAESQSLSTAQGNSDLRSRGPLPLSKLGSLNPSIQIRAIPTDTDKPMIAPEVFMSQSLSTDQGSFDGGRASRSGHP